MTGGNIGGKYISYIAKENGNGHFFFEEQSDIYKMINE